MGQVIGQMPETWDGLMEERDRVLYWSGEVLAKVADNVTNEDTFLMDYDHGKIEAKAMEWIRNNKSRIENVLGRFPIAKEQYEKQITDTIDKIAEEIRAKMKKDYRAGYGDLEKFTRKVDRLGKEQRKIHVEIQKLEGECAGNKKKFVKKFGPLRAKVFNNLLVGEKMLLEDKKLKTDFAKKVNDLDKKISNECEKKFEKLVKDFEKYLSKK